MKKFVPVNALLLLFLILSAAPVARAQFLDSSVGISAGLIRLFGTTPAFSARADLQVTDTNRQETLRTPMSFALLDSRMRLDFDLSQMRGKSVQPLTVLAMKQIGLDRIASLIRLDQKVIHLLFAGARSYVDMEMSPADTEAAAKNVQVLRTPLGRETLDNHPCTKHKTVVKSAKGAVLLEAFTWNAADLKEFPVQILLPSKEGTSVIRFTQVQLARPAAAQFDVPAGYTRYANGDMLVLAAAQKQTGAPQPAAQANSGAKPQAAKTAPPQKPGPPKSGTKAPVPASNPATKR